MMGKEEPAEDRFWQSVDVRGPLILDTKCWNWTASLIDGRYGQIWVKNTNVRAHRFAFEMAYGKIPKKDLVCHRCDNTLCVRPTHLFLGSPKDNTQDCIKKGRFKAGGHTMLKTRNVPDTTIGSKE